MLERMSKSKLQRVVERMFGKGHAHEFKGKFVLVHVDDPTPEVRAARLDVFDAAEFFDANCPHCRPFLDDGALMAYVEEDLVGIRLLPSGECETVMLRKPPLNLVQNGSANPALDDMRTDLPN